ncbi:hypothetical protein K432DRAFT_409418 [Lepidopterella palustris CBS 459.81]|uniref:Nuclear GTPase SLIP-GC n=1 Tax=Lepidopterella palustris CBS 459.81 TaxID=1314670 RepID=A0A8E2E060_9PEZI|nr:hypothetical protein K432DRAFT_409418 [Lepidopterella palustris CBS 459.81]
MNAAEFHEKAKLLKPDQQLPAKRYWVGVLFHHVVPDDILQEIDFLWIKAHSKITIQTIHNEYSKKYPSVSIVLKLWDEISSPTATLAHLNFYNDNVIILRAIEPSSMDNRDRVRMPLQPVNRQLISESSTVSADVAKPLPHPLSDCSLPFEGQSIKREPSASKTASPHENPKRLQPTTFQSTGRLQPFITAPASHTLNLDGPYSGGNIRTSTTPLSNRVDLATSSSSMKAEKEVDYPTPIQKNTDTEYKDEDEDGDAPMKDTSPDEVSYQPEEKMLKTEHLQKLMADTTPEKLEAGVQKAKAFLDALRLRLLDHVNDSEDARQWITMVENLQRLDAYKRTVVGVVGNTGAGKSSVINALLDEERLVPTNCMRACTAVVTEMSWNNSKDEHSKYRAEIEFISREDWERELGTLLRDLLDSNGQVSRECTDPDSEAGIAWAKFKAVYPQKTKEMLANTNVKSLMKDLTVLNVLGTTKKIFESQPGLFYKRLQRYVDSKEKNTRNEKKRDKKDKKQMEYWPLIKVVKIYTKSAALSTGAVIVDLPGVHDSNAARAAVAQGYMKQCTGLWIVAPINRAVDDKAAKSLLGESFKRQLKYDGTYSNVTFICSKTDDISITEAIDSLGLDEEVSKFEDQNQQLQHQIKQLQEEVNNLRDSKDIYKDLYEQADDDIELWQTIQDDVEDGKKVYAPKKKAEKRKRNSSKEKQRKKRNWSDSDESDSCSETNSSTEEVSQEALKDREPLTKDQVRDKIEELKAAKKNARRQRVGLDEKIKTTQTKIDALKQNQAAVRAEINAICIAGRNEYSKGAIQQDFAAGIKELDQENAIEEDEMNFNPDEDIRDYDQVARSLPVFCVSSRAYQKLCGRLKKDEPVPGFKTVKETEIPQLQAHCKKLTEAGRAQSCRSYLNSLSQLLNSLILWSSKDGTSLKLSDADKQKESHYLRKKLEELEKDLENAVTTCVNDIKDNIAENIYDKYDVAVEEAMRNALPTANGWGAHRDSGGLHFMTYKATVRRSGTYSGKSGPRDFNAELNEPITKHLATGWERAFQRRLPHALQNYTTASGNRLRSFHQAVEARARLHGASTVSLNMLANQLQVYEQIFANLAVAMVGIITEQQREANRSFTPVIAAAMSAVYTYASNESGAGMFVRIKNAMANHVERERHQMFNRATETVKACLVSMCRDVEEQMSNKTDEIFQQMRKDYMTTIGGAHLPQGTIIPKAERVVKDILNVLNTADGMFKEVLEGSVEDLLDENRTRGEHPAKDDDEDSNTQSANEDAEETADDTASIAKSSPATNTSARRGDAFETPSRDETPTDFDNASESASRG